MQRIGAAAESSIGVGFLPLALVDGLGEGVDKGCGRSRVRRVRAIKGLWPAVGAP